MSEHFRAWHTSKPSANATGLRLSKRMSPRWVLDRRASSATNAIQFRFAQCHISFP